MAETKRWAGLATRSQLKAANNLGTLKKQPGSESFRRLDLDLFDAYYEGRQYNYLPPWDQSAGVDGTYIPTRERAPRLQLNFARVLTSRLASKIVGERNFPRYTIEDDPETSELINLIIRNSKIKAAMLEPARRAMVSGSGLVRFSMNPGGYKIESFLAKWCFPEFDENDNLEFVKIQYVYEDPEDLDRNKNPKKKWFRMDLGKMTDVLYDNPEFSADVKEPAFQPVETVKHELGFVQAEWLRTSRQHNVIDGESLISDILGFIDELNYSLSQSSTAVQYNQDPQLAIKGMSEEELNQLIRSSTKAWNMGREGEASFLETSLEGVKTSMEFRDKIRLGVQDIARVVLLDPEKMVAHAQSGKAMEILHGPMVELIEELRPQFERTITNLILKMTLATLLMSEKGMLTPILIPPGYQPKSLTLTASWPEIFPKTMQDLREKVSVATSAASANIISRETMTRWLAKDFGVEDIEEELQKLATQPVINPFGGF